LDYNNPNKRRCNYLNSCFYYNDKFINVYSRGPYYNAPDIPIIGGIDLGVFSFVDEGGKDWIVYLEPDLILMPQSFQFTVGFQLFKFKK
jgi:hypothetical protein